MVVKLQALVHAFDHGFVVQIVLEKPLGRCVELEVLVDSRTLFNVVDKNNCRAELRLQIDMSGFKEGHREGKLRRIGSMSDRKTQYMY